MVLHAKVVTAGPRGNKCRNCEAKAKAPELILKAQGEYNRFSGFCAEDNFCSKCGLEKLEEAEERLKTLRTVLSEGPSDSSQLGSVKRRVV